MSLLNCDCCCSFCSLACSLPSHGSISVNYRARSRLTWLLAGTAGPAHQTLLHPTPPLGTHRSCRPSRNAPDAHWLIFLLEWSNQKQVDLNCCSCSCRCCCCYCCHCCCFWRCFCHCVGDNRLLLLLFLSYLLTSTILINWPEQVCNMRKDIVR